MEEKQTEINETEAINISQSETGEQKPQGEQGEKSKETIPFFSRKNLKRNIALGTILVVLIAGAIFLISFFSPKSIAERYCLAAIIDPAKIANYTAYDYKAQVMSSYEDEEDFYEKMSYIYDEDIKSWNDYAKILRESNKEDLEDEYGEYKITAKATKERDISVRKLESEIGWLYSMLEEYGFDADTITAGKMITVKVKLVGEDGNEKETVEVYMGKISGKWKVLDAG